MLRQLCCLGRWAPVLLLSLRPSSAEQGVKACYRQRRTVAPTLVLPAPCSCHCCWARTVTLSEAHLACLYIGDQAARTGSPPLPQWEFGGARLRRIHRRGVPCPVPREIVTLQEAAVVQRRRLRVVSGRERP